MELILSWTPNEYNAFIKGSQHKEIDEYEKLARNAMFHRYALNAKNPSEKKMFDANKARKRLESGSKRWKDSRDTEIKLNQYKRLKEALKGFKPVFHKKGGT